MRSENLDALIRLDDAARIAQLHDLPSDVQREIRYHWEVWARREQLPPPGPWHIWLIMAGRGFGKTRAGAEWVRHIARTQPLARIALVAGNMAEARSIMVEGESGILAVHPPDYQPHYEASLRRLTWPGGAQATLYSAAEPEGLRGPQHSHAWCDEIAKWDNSSQRAVKAWDNLMMGLRLGSRAQILATTTPRAVPLLRRLLKEAEGADASTVISRGTTAANAHNMPPSFIEAMDRTYGNSTLGRQELNGEMLEDIDGALWTRALIEQSRVAEVAVPAARIVVGVDPPISATGDACGIVVAGLDTDGRGVVLADCTIEKARPEQWARAVANAAALWDADRVIAEANQGGAMVGSVLQAADISLPIKLVHASRGKAARAEPVAALYEAGRVRHAGIFPELEDQLCGLQPGGAYHGPGRSPDRADALVWALTDLMLGKRGQPRVLPI